MNSCYFDVAHGATVDLIRVVDHRYLVTRVAVNRLMGFRGQGYASALLDTVCQAADDEGATLLLAIEPDESGGLDRVQLEGFYRRRGFRFFTDSSTDMVRNPKPHENGVSRIPSGGRHPRTGARIGSP